MHLLHVNIHPVTAPRVWGKIWPLPWVILRPGRCMNTDLARDLADRMLRGASVRSYLDLEENGQKADGKVFLLAWLSDFTQ